MVQVLANTNEQEAKLKREQEEAGDIFFWGIARLEGTKRLGAVFATAAGGRAYSLGSLLDDDNFKYMPKSAQANVAFARNVMFEKMQDIIAEEDTLESQPAQKTAQSRAAEAYVLRSRVNRRA